MITWIFMALDLISLGSLSLAHFHLAVSFTLLVISSIYLIGKGLIFRDFMSMLDLVSGVYILLVAVFHISSFVYYLVLAWFVYKLASTLSY